MDSVSRFSPVSISLLDAGGAAIQSICISGLFFRSSLAISISLIMCPSPREPLMNRIRVNDILLSEIYIKLSTMLSIDDFILPSSFGDQTSVVFYNGIGLALYRESEFYWSFSCAFFFSCSRRIWGRKMVTNIGMKMHIQIAGFTCITPYGLTSEIDWI